MLRNAHYYGYLAVESIDKFICPWISAKSSCNVFYVTKLTSNFSRFDLNISLWKIYKIREKPPSREDFVQFGFQASHIKQTSNTKKKYCLEALTQNIPILYSVC